MHATIDVRFAISIDDDKTIPLATLAEFVTEQNIESVLVESMVESLDASRVEAFCGQKHAHSNGDQRFQRAGTDTRTAVTTAGEHEFDLHYVEDTAADHDESSYFRPVEDILGFDGENRYQQDIAAKGVDLATSLSYRETADHGDGILPEMSSPTILTAFFDGNRDNQLDLVHPGRALDYNLWNDGVLSREQRNEIVSEVIDEGFHLKNSAAKHRPEEEFEAIRERIARTTERLEKTAWQLKQFGSEKAAGYLRRWLPSIMTFAEHAVEGLEVHGTSNPVGRLMGEVSKRCKNQWMRWTVEGLEALLQLRPVKYADPEYYRSFFDELLQRSIKTAISCDLSIEATRGKL